MVSSGIYFGLNATKHSDNKKLRRGIKMFFVNITESTSYVLEVEEGSTLQDVLDKAARNGSELPDDAYLNGCTVSYRTVLRKGDVIEVLSTKDSPDPEDLAPTAKPEHD